MDKVAIYDAVGQNVRAMRLKHGLKQGELAELVGMSRTSITNVETGRQSLLVDQLIRIAAALHVEAAELLPNRSLKKSELEPQLSPELSAWIADIRSGN